MSNFVVWPGTCGLAGLAVSLLGSEHVDPGEWPHPVRLIDVSDGDAHALVELARERSNYEIHYAKEEVRI